MTVGRGRASGQSLRSFLWLCWVFVAARTFSSVASAGHSLVAVCGLLISVASLVAELGLQGTRALVVVAHRLNSCRSQALEHKLDNRGPQAWLLCGRWDPPGPGIESVSPASASRFFLPLSHQRSCGPFIF